MNDVIVQFAILWGAKMASPWSREECEISEEMKQYDSEELLKIFSEWAEEYSESEAEDTVEFFEEKLAELLRNSKHQQKVYITKNCKNGWKVVADGCHVDCGNPLFDSCDTSVKGLVLCRKYCAENNLFVIRECQ